MNTLWSQAQNVLPGGVNSPVRAFGSVGRDPLFIDRAKGAYLFDVEDNKYIDYVGSWGPMILGHCQPDVVTAIQEAAAKGASFGCCSPLEVEFAEMVCERFPSLEMIRMVSSGTEATMSAIRLARGFTGREAIVKFRGCYHGHADQFLIEAGSGALTHGVPSSAGVTEGAAKDTLLADYNDLDSVKSLFESGIEIAAIILEVVPGNMGVVIPKKSFLQGLRDLCDSYGALLVFDEVMTGFRLSPSGAQGVFPVKPDLSTFGKIIGGGLPVGGYGGRRDVMQQISPLGPVYQAGTLSGNPMAMAAGIATLTLLTESVYQDLEEKAKYLQDGFQKVLDSLKLNYCINRVGSMLTLFFCEGPVESFEDAKRTNTEAYGAFFRGMLEEGVYLAPSGYEALFVSSAHTYEDLDVTIQAAKKVLS